MLRQTHGNAVTSRNEAGNRSTPGGGPESGMFPGQPIYWVSDGMLRHSHRPRPTLGAGQGPMLKSIGQEVAKGDRQQRKYGCASNARAFLTPWKITHPLRLRRGTLGQG